MQLDAKTGETSVSNVGGFRSFGEAVWELTALAPAKKMIADEAAKQPKLRNINTLRLLRPAPKMTKQRELGLMGLSHK